MPKRNVGYGVCPWGRGRSAGRPKSKCKWGMAGERGADSQDERGAEVIWARVSGQKGTLVYDNGKAQEQPQRTK